MSNPQCRCATECEWLPEHYSLEHHPGCQVMKRRGAVIENNTFHSGEPYLGIQWKDMPSEEEKL